MCLMLAKRAPPLFSLSNLFSLARSLSPPPSLPLAPSPSLSLPIPHPSPKFLRVSPSVSVLPLVRSEVPELVPYVWHLNVVIGCPHKRLEPWAGEWACKRHARADSILTERRLTFRIVTANLKGDEGLLRLEFGLGDFCYERRHRQRHAFLQLLGVREEGVEDGDAGRDHGDLQLCTRERSSAGL